MNRHYYYCFLICFYLLAGLPSAIAQPSNSQSVQQQSLQSIHQQLQVDRERNIVAGNKLEELDKLKKNKWDKITPLALSSEEVENKQLALAVANADLINVEQVWMDVQQQLHDTQDRISHLEDNLQDARAMNEKSQNIHNVTKLQEELGYLISYRDVLYKRASALDVYKSTAERIVQIEQDVTNSLKTLYHQKQNAIREKQLIELNAVIQQERSQILEKLQGYNQSLQSITLQDRERSPLGVKTNMQIFEAGEKLYLADLKLSLARINDEIADISALVSGKLLLPEIDELIIKLNSIQLKIDNILTRIQAKNQLIDSKRAILRQSLLQKVITGEDFQHLDAILHALLIDYQNKAKVTESYRNEALQDKDLLQQALRTSISTRQILMGWDAQSWIRIAHKFVHLPSAFYSACITLQDHLGLVLATITTHTIYLLIFIEFALVLGSLYFNRFSNLVLANLRARGGKTTNHLLFALISLIQDNLLAITISAMSLMIFILLGVPFKLYRFLAYVILVWFLFRFILGIARYLLVENTQYADGEDVKLYYRLRTAVIVGGGITALTVLAHQLSVAYEIRDLFNRLFMLFLLGLSLILFRNRKIIPQLLRPFLLTQRQYVVKAIDILFALLPLTLMSNALLGLVGYVQLAWIMGYHQVMILLILTGYIILRGVLIDIMESLAEFFIQSLQNGWLWTQALLKPIDKVLRFSLFLSAIVALFLSFGWNADSRVVKHLEFIFKYPFLSFTGGQISLLSVTEFAILAAIIAWAARWAREFTYRWVFAAVADIGIRNSLAIFSQYATVLSGSILTLHVLGLDFSGLSYILGGLAVGMGFGLRDFANNIISGIMILIERPVREGDLVTVGDYEGTVQHIGIRSMVVKSWDHMAVMIPNAETLNKSFTNWTHQDNIVRTVLPIKIHRLDDPVQVQSIIMSCLHEQPFVLMDPAPEVYLSRLDDVLIEFEVRYFINVRLHPRVAVKSVVLFAIYQAFQQAGIRSPYPQQAVELLNPVIE